MVKFRAFDGPIGKWSLVFPLLALAWTAIVFLTTPVTDYYDGFDFDGRFYGVMAGSDRFAPSLARQAPWAYRVLTPFQVSLLPGDTLRNFRILAFVSNILSLWILFLVFRKLQFSDAFCFFGVLLYAGVFWTLKFSFYSPAYIDWQTQMFLLLIIYLSLSERYLLLIPIFALAALQKESLAGYSLFTAVHLLRNRRHADGLARKILLFSLVAVPFSAVFLVRLFVSADRPASFFSFATHLSRMSDPRFWPIFFQAVFSGLGLLPVFLMLGYGAWMDFLKKRPEWIVFLLLSTLFLFGGLDKARLFLYMLPAAALLSLYAARFFETMRGGRRFFWWAFSAVLLHFYMGGYLTPMGTFSDYLDQRVPVHSGGGYLPFLIRNCFLSLAFGLFTLYFLLGEWRFSWRTGFSRRDGETNAASME